MFPSIFPGIYLHGYAFLDVTRQPFVIEHAHPDDNGIPTTATFAFRYQYHYKCYKCGKLFFKTYVDPKYTAGMALSMDDAYRCECGNVGVLNKPVGMVEVIENQHK